MDMPKIDGTLLTLLVGGVLAGIGGIWRELRVGFAAQSEAKSLRDDVTELRADIAALKDRQAASDIEIRELRVDKAILEETLAVTKAEVKELRAQSKELRSQKDRIEAELACVRQQVGGGGQ